MKHAWLPRRMQPLLLLLTSAIVLMAILGHSAFTLRQQIGTAQSSIENQARALVKNVAVTVGKPLVLGSFDELELYLMRSIEFPDVQDLLICDADGRVLSHVGRRADGAAHIIIDSISLRLQPPAQARSVLSAVEQHMLVWEPVVAGSTLGWVRANFSTAALDTIRDQILRTTLIAAAIAIAASSFLLYLTLRRPMQALEHARQFAIRLDQSDGKPLSLMPAPVEIEDLQTALHHASLRLHAQRQELAHTIGELCANQMVVSERNSQLDAIFKLSPDGFLTFNREGRVQYASPAFFRMTCLPEDQVIGASEEALSQRIADLCIPTVRFRGVDKLKEYAQADVTDKASREIIELGKPLERVLEVGLRKSDAQSVSRILYFRDITYETEVDRMKSEFLSTAAHELRTPMASIFGFSELLIHEEFDADSRREFLGTIYRQSELMVSIINELLDLARIEARRGKDFVLEPLDLADVVARTLQEYRPPNGREPAVCEAAQGPLPVVADASKIRQAFLNLVANAFKFSPAGGTVQVKFVREKHAGEKRVGVCVQDPGMGMTPEQQARVFERFYRADHSGKIPGTGLGMSIVKEIVEIHHGTVELSSQAGVGTLVTLWLPQAPSAADPGGDEAFG
jgi:signal transduction histidine kinase